MSAPPEPSRRPRGRPKGSKNGPNAGPVGRPRKDGQAPRKHSVTPSSNPGSRSVSVALQGTLNAWPPAHENVLEDPQMSHTTSLVDDSATRTTDSHATGHDALSATAAAPVLAPSPTCEAAADSVPEGPREADNLSRECERTMASTAVAAGRNLLSTASISVTGLAVPEVDGVEGGTPVFAKQALRNPLNLWSPPKGISLRDSYDDGEDQEEDDIFDDGVDGDLGDEFNGVVDDDENTMDDAASQGTGPSRVETAATKVPPKVERQTMPMWLHNDYADTRERLTAEMRENPSRKPTCYDRGTFLDGPFFSFFTADRKLQPTPADFHKPQYFILLPHLLVDCIPCPACIAAERRGRAGTPVYLVNNGWPKGPRRVVDLDQCIYVIGYRYRCSHPSCKRSFQSWSPSLLAALPRALALQFPYHLTRRNGLSDRVVAMMRGAVLHGIGPGPFSEIIQTNHIRRFEQLHLQYLEMVYARYHSAFARLLSKFLPFGSFNDRDGYAGYTPSAQYFRNFYVKFLQSHSAEMDQYTAMLTAKFLQLDHSFKVPDHLGRLQGVPVYSALHTGFNEYSEIRSMLLTPTKAHNQFMPALQLVAESLKTYGHEPIQIIYTDNPAADKQELESALPCLLKDVVSVPDPTSLPHLTVSENANIVILSSTFQVNTRLGSIITDIEDGSDFFIGLDMEWPVNQSEGISGRVSLISLTYGKDIFLIPLSTYSKPSGYLQLPHMLLAFLQAPRIFKVGVQVSGDLTRLFRDCGFVSGRDPTFEGALNLGQLAKDHGAASKATVSLADLSATVLKRYLPKDLSIRVSEGWSMNPLPSSHANYAALDVYASWAIFKALTSTSVGQPISDTTPCGTPVTLFSSDQSREIAQGHIALDRPKHYGGVNITKTRILITIVKVLVPGHLISQDLTSNHCETPLSSFLPVPFNLVCKMKHLRTCKQSEENIITQAPQLSSMVVDETNVSHSGPSLAPPPPASQPASEPNICDSNTTATTTEPTALSDLDDDMHDGEEQSVESSVRDPAGHAKAIAIAQASATLQQQNQVLRSRVLGDIWHLMDRFSIPRKHGLRKPFYRALRHAFFNYDIEDKANIEDFLREKGVTFDYMMKSHSSWVLRRVRRFVPPPDILLPRVLAVVETFGPLRDATSGEPLFGDDDWSVVENTTKEIFRGYYSDPPDVQLYYTIGKDKYGLTRYRCCRGTSGIEGGVHQNIIRWFGAFNASPEFAVEMLRDYVLHHNLRVGTRNRTGKPYHGSFDIWTRNQISRLLDILSSRFTELPAEFGLGGWVNGDNYVPSSEAFGILPLSESTRERLGMHVFHPVFAKEQKIRHEYLAQKQNTRIAVLPVHTKAERALFKMLVANTQGMFANRREPNWETVAIRWVDHSDGKMIFYKLPEHLKSYWKNWGELANEQSSIKINETTYRQIATLLNISPTKTLAPAQPTPLGHQITDGARTHGGARTGENADIPVERWHLSNLLNRHSLTQAAIHYAYADVGPSLTVAVQRPLAQPMSEQRLGKRKAIDEGGGVPVHRRKPRTCPRCHHADCAGRFNSRPCNVEQ